MTDAVTPEDRLRAGEASELDLLVIVKKLAEDLLEARDALASVVAAFAGHLADEEADFEGQFGRGLLRTYRDYTDEYQAILTTAGERLVRANVAAALDEGEGRGRTAASGGDR